MTRSAAVLCSLLIAAIASAAAKPPSPHTGDEATGDHVLALWQFEPGAELRDSSGKGHTLTLRGQARAVKSGRFGGGLESFPALTDTRQGAMTAKVWPDLSPEGAFTLELWLQPKPAMAEQRTVFLLDSKYYPYPKDLPRANTGYMFYLRCSSSGCTPVAMLGYGQDSAEFIARPIALDAGAWHHLAFTYDGAGTGRILLDGKDVGGTTHAGRGSIAPAAYALTLGDRYGSVHGGCAAILDEVRITKGVQIGGLSIQAGTRNGRTAFRRMEQVGPLRLSLANHTEKPLTAVTVRVAFGGESVHRIPVLPPRASHVIEVPLNTRLRPDRYELVVAAQAKAGDRTLEADHVQPIVIVPRALPHVMPVVMWGSGDFERLLDIGFTHHIQHAADYDKPWATGQPVEPEAFNNVQAARENLNRHLAAGLGVVYRLDPGRWLERKGLCLRVDRTGKPYDKAQICAALPKVQQFGYNVGASIARAVGAFPAFQSALIHTEIRGHTAPCFHDHDKAAFRKATGIDTPREVTGRTPPRYDSLPAFPADRVVPDDHPLLVYYRWFWSDGDGWNPLHGEVSRGLHSTGRDDLWTFYDPAVRVPSLWGSGGTVDVISQWSYVYPDPLKIGQAT
ncbi:LamG domain-containing protein, partial [bacterium]|nr:LamG domain-containing protein [bacterium]